MAKEQITLTEAIRNAFKEFNVLSESEIFNMSDDEDLVKLDNFLRSEDNSEDVESVIDPEAQDDSELKDSYEGDIIIQCAVCKAKIYRNPDEVILEEDDEFCNLEDICPHCGSQEGYVIIGKVAPLDDEDIEEIEDNTEEAQKEDAEEEKEDNDSEEEVVEEPAEEVEEMPEEEQEEEVLEESVNNELNEKIPADLVKAYKNTQHSRKSTADPNNYMRLKRYGRRGNDRYEGEHNYWETPERNFDEVNPQEVSDKDYFGNTIDFENSEFIEITAQEALALKREKKASVVKAIVDEYCAEFNDEGICLNNFSLYGDYVYKTKTGKRINNVAEMPFSHIVAVAEKIYKEEAQYISDEKKLRRKQNRINRVPDTGDHEEEVKSRYDSIEYYEKENSKYQARIDSCKAAIAELEAENQRGDLSPNAYAKKKAAYENDIKWYQRQIDDNNAHINKQRWAKKDKAAAQRNMLSNDMLQRRLRRFKELKKDLAGQKRWIDGRIQEYRNIKADGKDSEQFSWERRQLADLRKQIANIMRQIEYYEERISAEKVDEKTEKIYNDLMARIDEYNKDAKEQAELLGKDYIPFVFTESIDTVNESKFEELATRYFRNVYENVDTFTATRAANEGNKLILEGKINFKSGKSKPTTFVLEYKETTKRNKLKFVGMNESVSKSKKAFTLHASLNDRCLMFESMIYNYTVKEENLQESKQIYGRAVVLKESCNKVVEEAQKESISNILTQNIDKIRAAKGAEEMRDVVIAIANENKDKLDSNEIDEFEKTLNSCKGARLLSTIGTYISGTNKA